MRCVFALALLGLTLCVPVLVAAPAQQKHSHTKPAKGTSSPKAAASSKARSSSKVKGRTSARRTRRGKRVAARPSYQLHPDPERYQQIQQALASRGYFKGPVNGVWGDDSVDALRRFQTDQKMSENEGKINALSLNALGLGAKHDSSSLSASALAGKADIEQPPPSPTEEPADGAAAPDSSPATPPN
jgi:peptidoglycan hydrolase-like protein with peptidoglycan-binding domain